MVKLFSLVFAVILLMTEAGILLDRCFQKLAFRPATNFIKKRFQYRCFPVKFAKLLETPFLPNNSSGYFCYDSETYDMIKLYLSVYLYLFLLYSSLFSV